MSFLFFFRAFVSELESSQKKRPTFCRLKVRAEEQWMCGRILLPLARLFKLKKLNL